MLVVYDYENNYNLHVRIGAVRAKNLRGHSTAFNFFYSR